MADDIDWLDLPGRWTYGVCGDGRVFFIKYVFFLLGFSLCYAWGQEGSLILPGACSKPGSSRVFSPDFGGKGGLAEGRARRTGSAEKGQWGMRRVLGL